MLSDQQFLSLVDAIYAAAVDESQWPSVLEKLIAITDSRAASLWILENDGRLNPPTVEYIDFDSSFVQEYLHFKAPEDPTNQHLALHPNERIVQDSSFTEPSEVELFALLFRHVERAIKIGFRLGTLGNLQQATSELLDRNPVAIVLLDEGGRLVLANQAARRIDAARDGIRLSSEGVKLAAAADDRKLQPCISDALTAGDAAARPGGAVWAFRPSGKRPFSILVSPLSSASFTMTSLRPAACIVIADPDQTEMLPAERLRALYGLTAAEARLATRLAAGDALKSAAETIGVSHATARSQLAAIFRKTETRRQGELVRLILTTVPLLQT